MLGCIDKRMVHMHLVRPAQQYVQSPKLGLVIHPVHPMPDPLDFSAFGEARQDGADLRMADFVAMPCHRVLQVGVAERIGGLVAEPVADKAHAIRGGRDAVWAFLNVGTDQRAEAGAPGCAMFRFQCLDSAADCGDESGALACGAGSLCFKSALMLQAV